MRGVDDGTGLDPDADDREQSAKGGNSEGVGSVQNDSFQEHAHYQLEHTHRDRYHLNFLGLVVNSGGTSFLMNTITYGTTDAVAPAISGAIKYKNNGAVKLSSETRPKNAGVYFIIKVK